MGCWMGGFCFWCMAKTNWRTTVHRAAPHPKGPVKTSKESSPKRVFREPRSLRCPKGPGATTCVSFPGLARPSSSCSSFAVAPVCFLLSLPTPVANLVFSFSSPSKVFCYCSTEAHCLPRPIAVAISTSLRHQTRLPSCLRVSQ